MDYTVIIKTDGKKTEHELSSMAESEGVSYNWSHWTEISIYIYIYIKN